VGPLYTNCGMTLSSRQCVFGEGQLPATQDNISALEAFRFDGLSRCPAASTASGPFLERPAMAFGELYEFREVVLSFARPQETVRSKEVHVCHLHQLHGRRPEAGRNK
jgi:hypothetical protein